MGRFRYSEDELDINRVLKMNQDISTALLADSDLSLLRESADSNIELTLEILRSLGKNREIIKIYEEVDQKRKDRKLEHRPELESWEEIVAQAYQYEPRQISLEDIMTQNEIQDAFDELNDINKQFSRKTSIVNKIDLSFLAIAIALQVVKSILFPYVAKEFNYGEGFDPSERLKHNDASIEAAHRDANDKFRDKHIEKHGTGHWINLLYQTVPYDIVKGSKDLGINMGGMYHRMYTLGHDPILGWLFGTANILTDCITFNNFQTNRVSRIDSITGKKRMKITEDIVSIGEMLNECYQEIKMDYLNLPAALYAQAQHLKSDEYTKVGLPVPLLSSINENFASKLYKENYDALCFSRDIKIVGISFLISKFFDIIISLTHGIFRKEDENKDLFEVRTRKILLVSNSIASTSAIINTAITKNLKNMDIGSILNTIAHLFCDLRFIIKIKQEYIENEISNRLQKEITEIDNLFQKI